MRNVDPERGNTHHLDGELGHAECVAARGAAGRGVGAGALWARAADLAPGAAGVGTEVVDLRPGPVVHPALHVGRAGAAGDLGPQARGTRAGPGRVPADPDERARGDDLRALPPAIAADAPA